LRIYISITHDFLLHPLKFINVELVVEIFTDDYFMGKALDEAQIAFEEQEIPIGAVVVLGNKVIGRGHNQTERLRDVTAHAEMIAITAASAYLNSKYLEECTLYVTVEPCLMCAGAIQWSRLNKVVFGAYEPKFGFTNTTPGLLGTTDYKNGVLEMDCKKLMQDFFKNKRK
jgi:tRNA(adenine34) deaminase